MSPEAVTGVGEAKALGAAAGSSEPKSIRVAVVAVGATGWGAGEETAG